MTEGLQGRCYLHTVTATILCFDNPTVLFAVRSQSTSPSEEVEAQCSLSQGVVVRHPERRTKSVVEPVGRHEVSGSLIDRLSRTPHPPLRGPPSPTGEGLQRTVETACPYTVQTFRYATDYLTVASGPSGRLSLQYAQSRRQDRYFLKGSLREVTKWRERNE